jgi:hypothetical protein
MGRPTVERVTSARQGRKPLGRQFREVFFTGDFRTAIGYGVTHVVIPAIQDTILDVINVSMSRLILGDSRARGARTNFTRPNPSGNMDYAGISRGPYRGDDRPPQPRQISQSARSRNSFNEIIIPDRGEAEDVIDRLYDLISQYDVALVADLFAMTGIQASHTDQKWGWRDLEGVHLRRHGSGGYALQLPAPEPL